MLLLRWLKSQLTSIWAEQGVLGLTEGDDVTTTVVGISPNQHLGRTHQRCLQHAGGLAQQEDHNARGMGPEEGANLSDATQTWTSCGGSLHLAQQPSASQVLHKIPSPQHKQRMH